MKFFLISDNIDTQMGLRLAGIDGVVVHTFEEVKKALDEVLTKKDIAVVLITEKLVNICNEMVYDIKLNRSAPLILEIPDRHGKGRSEDSIAKYVREAIGVKI